MRLQPGLMVVAPADSAQAREAVIATQRVPGPVYFRLGKDDKAVVPGLGGRFELGRAERLREGGTGGTKLLTTRPCVCRRTRRWQSSIAIWRITKP